MKEANLKRLQTGWFQLYDTVEKVKLWKQNDQCFPGLSGEGMNKQVTEDLEGSESILMIPLMVDVITTFVKTQGKQGLPWWLSGKESTSNAGDTGDRGSIPGLGRSLRGGHGNSFQYFCLDRGAWWATDPGVAKSQTQPKWLGTHAWDPEARAGKGAQAAGFRRSRSSWPQ